MMDNIEGFTKNFHGLINSFKIHMEEQLYEPNVPDLASQRKEVAILRLEVCTLEEIYPLILLMLYLFYSISSYTTTINI